MSTDVLTPRVRVVREHHLVKELALQGPLTVGRLPDNDIVIDDDVVSGHHGRIERVGNHWRYVDLGSTNGSIIAAGPTLRGGESFDLVEDCQVMLGTTVLDIRLEADSTFILKRERPAGEPDSGDTAPDLPPTHPRMLVVQGGRCKTVAITAPRVTLGRAHRCEVHIEDASVSSRHAELHWDGLRWMLRDLASSNGTRVGVHKVTRARPISDGEHLILGAVDLLFVEDGPEPEAAEILAALEADGRVDRAQAREARQEWSAGQAKLGEILVRRALLSPGEWHEIATGAVVRPRSSGGKRVAWIVGAALMLTAAVVVAWLLTR